MRKTLPISLVGLMLATLPYDAYACRRPVTAEQFVTGQYDAVVVARVTRAAVAETDPFRPGLWRADANWLSTVSGKTNLATFQFAGIDSPDPCIVRQQVAIVGEAWVLYLQTSPKDKALYVTSAFPLSVARKIDKRFTGQP